MPIISRPLYVYLQRPDNGVWVTVGRYRAGAPGEGTFRYAPSYVDAGLAWPIDPVNLRFLPDLEVAAPRYRGLHDVLRDTCPDAWGQSLLRQEHNLPDNAPPLQYLQKAGNLDRWGALAVGASIKIPQAGLGSPSPPPLDHVVEELAALSERRPAIRARIRSRLIQTASVGGARPKATVEDDKMQSWLVKPGIASDVANIPLLEHVGQQWGAASGLNFAPTVFHPSIGGRSAVRVLRFDRHRAQRLMCVSAASMLQAEYPDDLTQTGRWSYPRLARNCAWWARRRKTASNCLAAWYSTRYAATTTTTSAITPSSTAPKKAVGAWRLRSTSFPIRSKPRRTFRMQLSLGRFDISREAVLADAHRFGFSGEAEAVSYLDRLLPRIEAGFVGTAHWLDLAWRQVLHERLTQNLLVLKGQAAGLRRD